MKIILTDRVQTTSKEESVHSNNGWFISINCIELCLDREHSSEITTVWCCGCSNLVQKVNLQWHRNPMIMLNICNQSYLERCSKKRLACVSFHIPIQLSSCRFVEIFSVVGLSSPSSDALLGVIWKGWMNITIKIESVLIYFILNNNCLYHRTVVVKPWIIMNLGIISRPFVTLGQLSSSGMASHRLISPRTCSYWRTESTGEGLNLKSRAAAARFSFNQRFKWRALSSLRFCDQLENLGDFFWSLPTRRRDVPIITFLLAVESTASNRLALDGWSCWCGADCWSHCTHSMA